MDENDKHLSLIISKDGSHISNEKVTPLRDSLIKTYTINHSLNGGYIVHLTYEDDRFDYMAFTSSFDLISALQLILK